MTPELYRRASDLFNQFRVLPAHARAQALDSACGADGELRTEVTRLLEADLNAAGDAFLERPALEDAARLLRRAVLDVPAVGTVIGNYRLEERLGAGGMGVVFAAHDLHLQRRVAVKVLPLGWEWESKERVQRFQREARAVSLLNHPNVVSIFDAGFEHGWCYIAMELVEGKTLRQWMGANSIGNHDGKLILDVISQAAAALSAAHRADIVHRDIKPENIMVRDDGIVKVLDFGLAKLRETERTTGSGAAVELSTHFGQIAGTMAYLSPEQILGEAVGPRSDLFSLGVVAYELATGVRPFEGTTDGAVLNAILNHAPGAPSALNPYVGAELEALILRLLEKDPDLRFQTAGDLRSSCRRLTRDHVESALEQHARQNGTAGRAVRRRSFPWLACAALAVTLAAGAVWLLRPPPMPRVTGIVQITHDGLPKGYFVNDGKRLYFASGQGNNNSRVFEVSTRGGDPVALPLPAGMLPLDITLDGSELLLMQFRNGQGGKHDLWAASSLGGAPRRLGDLTAEDARWSPQGDWIVYCATPELRIARADGSDSRVVTVIQSQNLRNPDWSPDGKVIRFTVDKEDVSSLWEVRPDGTHLHRLFDEQGHYRREQGVSTPDGKYFVFSGGPGTHDLWVTSLGRQFSFFGKSVFSRLTVGPLLADLPQPSPDGHHVFFRGRLDRGELTRLDANTGLWVPYLLGLSGMQLDYSRDGKWITYASYPDASLWRCAADGSQRRQLTVPPLMARNPRWSPDGTQIVFHGILAGKPSRLYLVSAAGGAARQLTHGEAGPGGDEEGNWLPDGHSIIFSAKGGDHFPNDERQPPLRVMDLRSGRVETLPDSYGLWSPRVSPDGRYIAALGAPLPGVWLYDLTTHRRRQIMNVGESWPSWSRDGRYVYLFNAEAERVRVSDGKVEHVASWKNLAIASWGQGWLGLAPDGSLLSIRDSGSTEIYALDWETP
jgi:serine/threonine protein kinase/Tol biopolymer transport system component